MAVTIQMIETKEFKTVSRGYDPEEVDVFLDEIADEFEEMQREIQSLRMSSRSQPAPAPAPVSADNTTETVQKMLASAQRVSEETMAEARKQAEILLTEARAKAAKMVEDAKNESTRLQDGLDALRSAANDYRARFKRLLDDQLQLLAADNELFK